MTRPVLTFLLALLSWPVIPAAPPAGTLLDPTDTIPRGFAVGYDQPVFLGHPLQDTLDLPRLGSGDLVVLSVTEGERGLAIFRSEDGVVRAITHYFPYDTPFDSVVASYRGRYGPPRDSATSDEPGHPSTVFTWCDQLTQLDIATARGATRIHVYEILIDRAHVPACQARP